MVECLSRYLIQGTICILLSTGSFLFVCFVCLILYVTSTIFQLNRDGSSWVEAVLSLDKCVLLKDRNAVTPVRLEPAAPRFRVKHSTTEPRRFLVLVQSRKTANRSDMSKIVVWNILTLSLPSTTKNQYLSAKHVSRTLEY